MKVKCALLTQVNVEKLLKTRSLNFHHYFLSIMQDSSMDLQTGLSNFKSAKVKTLKK